MQISLLLMVLTLPLVFLFSDQKMPPKVIVLFGPPASGKGTQAVRLAEKLHIPHISTGDLFRDNISKNTPLGSKAKQYIDAGNLVPDELVLELLFDRLNQPDVANGFILDGVPRTLDQAYAIEKKLPPQTEMIVLNLAVPDNIIVERALGRKRADDTLQVIQQRLQTYHKQTAPLLDYFSKKGILINIDGEKTPDQVFSNLVDALQK